MKYVLLATLLVACGGKLTSDSPSTSNSGPPLVSEVTSDSRPDAGIDAGSPLPACEESAGSMPRECTCDDNQDNDGDGLVDCEDPDCAGRQGCQ